MQAARSNGLAAPSGECVVCENAAVTWTYVVLLSITRLQLVQTVPVGTRLANGRR